VDDKLLFADMGAYSLIKASRFNGYALPAIYLCQQGELSLVKNDDYADYRRQWCME
jgi:carboxynorspermidine decarboxylase